jgi:hypothetical protein
LRLNEAAGARRSEIEGDVWTISPARMKGKNAGNGNAQARAHVVPITGALRKIFASVQRGEGDAMFAVKTSSRVKTKLDEEMTAILRQRAKARGEDVGKVALRPWRNHDIRRTCRSTLSRLRIDPDTAERVLAHRLPGVKGIYDVWERYDEKRAALEAWSEFLADLIRPQPIETTRRKRANVSA